MNGMLKIEALNRENYDTWRMQMEAILVKNDALGYVTGRIRKPEDEAAALEWELADSKAKADIILAISPSELRQVRGCSTSQQVWEKLMAVYQSKGPARKATLLKKLILTRMNGGDDVRDHIDSFFDVVDKLEAMEVVINEDLLTIMLLYSLPDDFENFRVAIESRDVLPSPQVLKVKILEENDARRGYRLENDDNEAFLGRYPKKTLDKGQYDNVKYKPFPFKCRTCNSVGHKAKFCPNKKPGTNDNAALAEDEFGFNVIEQPFRQSSNFQWCLDSGCSSHMTHDYSAFLHCQPDVARNVNLADKSSTKSRGIGTAIMKIDGGRTRVHLYNTLYVPELRTNLVSVGRITDKGYHVVFKKDVALVLDEKGNVKLTADRRNGLYYIRQGNSSEEAHVSADSSTTLLTWHQKFGHLNFRDLRKIINNQSVLGVDAKGTEEVSACETCIKGKFIRKPFPKQSIKSNDMLEIVHSDICGPMRVESFGKSKYFITFTDDYSRWTEVMFLKKKSDALDAFKRYKQMVENISGKKIKYFQTDRGGELLSHDFTKFLEKCGIRRRLACSMTPQQNGVAERKNRTLNDMARCLLLEANLPQIFWAEAVATAAHVRI